MAIALEQITTSYSITGGELIRAEIRTQLNKAKNNAADYGYPISGFVDSDIIYGNSQFRLIQNSYQTISSTMGFGNAPPSSSYFDTNDTIDDAYVSPLVSSIKYYSTCRCNYNNYYKYQYCVEKGTCTCNTRQTRSCSCNVNFFCTCQTVYATDIRDYNYCSVCSSNYVSCSCNKYFGCVERRTLDEIQGCQCNSDKDTKTNLCSTNLRNSSCLNGCTCNADGCRCNSQLV